MKRSFKYLALLSGVSWALTGCSTVLDESAASDVQITPVDSGAPVESAETEDLAQDETPADAPGTSSFVDGVFTTPDLMIELTDSKVTLVGALSGYLDRSVG